MHQPIAKPFIKGSALIVALLLMALVAIIATMMMLQQQTQIQQTTLVINNDRMYVYGKAVENWAITLLNSNLAQAESNQSGNQTLDDTPIDTLPQAFTNITVNNAYYISGSLEDLQGRFNLNNLVSENAEKQFAALIMAVDPDIEKETATNIAKATHDWVSPPKKASDNSLLTGDASTPATTSSSNQATPANSQINRFYTTKRRPPYRAAQAYMASASELRLVRGVTPQLYLRLQPFIVALPGKTKININAASAPVLASLGDGMSLDDAVSLVQNRSAQPYTSLDDFFNDDTVQKANIPKTSVTLNSKYFLVNANISTSNEKMVLRAMLYRDLPQAGDTTDTEGEDNNSSTPTRPKTIIMWESRGGI